MRKPLTTLAACFVFWVTWVTPLLSQVPAGVAGNPCVGVGATQTGLFQNLSCNMDSLQATYGAVAQGLTTAAAATDVACLTGAAGKVIRIKKIRIAGTTTTAALTANVYITKHAVADTGGTLATGTALPVPYSLDSTQPAPSATAQSWTANPTINDGSPGIIGASTVVFPLSTGVNSPGAVPFNWGDTGPATAVPVLRSAAQQLCINLNNPGTSIVSLSIEFFWTEAGN